MFAPRHTGLVQFGQSRLSAATPTLSGKELEARSIALRTFYGWYLLGFVWVLYGFQASPGYYSWSFFAVDIMEELELTRAQIGNVFGLLMFMLSIMSPLSGMAIARWGARSVLVVGNLIMAVGFWGLSGASTLLECYLYYGFLVGGGMGLGTYITCQTLATDWFTKYRARAVAIILTAGGVVGKLVYQFDALMVQQYTWRTGWFVLALLTLMLAFLGAVLVRNRPADLGQHPDGIDHTSADAVQTLQPERPSVEIWTLPAALRTSQFAVLCLSAVACFVPWTVCVGHGRLHLEGLGLSTDVAAGVLGTMVLVSIAGRLTGGLGDFLVPEKVLGFALLIEGVGVLGFLFAQTTLLAYLSTTLLALGFGAGYISLAVVLARFFGQAVFAQILGVNYLVSGIVQAISPGMAGWTHDVTGSYRIAFITVALLTITGALFTLCLRVPQPPVEVERMPG